MRIRTTFVTGLLLLGISETASAILITSGYAVQQFYRDCTRKACGDPLSPTTDLPTYGLNFSLTGTALQDPTDAEFFLDRGEDTAALGSANTSATGPGTANYPVLKASSSSILASRVSTVVSGVQRYQNNGLVTIDLRIGARLDGVLSKEVAPWEDLDFDGNVIKTAESLLFGRLAVFTNLSGFLDTGGREDRPDLDPLFAANCIGAAIFATTGCGSDVSLIYSSERLITADGAFDEAFDPFSGNGVFTLNPGESIFLGASFTTVVVNGGSVNAFDSFRTAFVDVNGNEITPLDGLVPITRVSEPSTLGLLGLGLLMSLGIVRRRLLRQRRGPH